jgi:hypothetical protein
MHDGNERASGRYMQRLPRWLHEDVQTLARQEGISQNLLTATLLADALARRMLANGPAPSETGATPQASVESA